MLEHGDLQGFLGAEVREQPALGQLRLIGE
jgi:hypothetical protein